MNLFVDPNLDPSSLQDATPDEVLRWSAESIDRLAVADPRLRTERTREYALADRETLDTQLNVFEHFEPKLSDVSKAADVLFLANIQPDLQLEVRNQVPNSRFVAMDSMNLWIDIAREPLVKVIERVDCVILNDAELRQLTEKPNLITALRVCPFPADGGGQRGRPHRHEDRT